MATSKIWQVIITSSAEDGRTYWMVLSTVMTHCRHTYPCQKTTHPLPLAQAFTLISRRMNTKSIIGGYERGASIAITRDISTSNAAFLTSSVISKDERSVSSPHSIASISWRHTRSAPTMGCIVCGCGSRNNERSANESEGDRDIRRTQVCLRQSYAQVGHMIMHDSSSMHGFGGSSNP